LTAAGYTRNLFLGDGGGCVEVIVDDEGITEAALRDESEQVLGVRDPYCF